MAQENYVKGFSMQRPPLLEAEGFCFWKNRFETYIKSKDIDLWQVIQNDDFYFEIEDSETKMMKETPSKLTAIEEAYDLATLPLDELIGSLKVYEMVLDNDDVASKTTKEKVKSLALKTKVTVEQTSEDNDSQGGSEEDVTKKRRKHTTEAKTSVEGHFASEYRKPKKNKAFVGGAWSDSEDGNEPQNDATCLMEIDSQEIQPNPSISNNDLDIIDLQ
ncbi:hypothetical protein Tco_0820676 [Tanacetum coccineum]|uniref:DUF4219 domain-containing protein n=1 Tax=Tanacetum coccineum TaxID=301880 RepID=A0ABQ5ACQ2_9ASTR